MYFFFQKKGQVVLTTVSKKNKAISLINCRYWFKKSPFDIFDIIKYEHVDQAVLFATLVYFCLTKTNTGAT